jgi:membrane protein implicated in regulation of membrane protease activity
MWMGLVWIGLGIFFLIRGGFVLPRINLELGWIVIVLGIVRVYWWWLSVEKPRRDREARKKETQALLEETGEAENP